MSARDGLGLLPFSDYADDDPNGQLRIGDEPEPRRCHCGGAASGTGDYPDVCDQWPLCERVSS